MFTNDITRILSCIQMLGDEPGSQRLASLLTKDLEWFERLQHVYEVIMTFNSGSPLGIELARHGDTGVMYCAILPEPDGSSRGRIVQFNKDFMYRHESFATPEQALEQALRRGYTELSTGVMDAFATTPAWRRCIAHADRMTCYPGAERDVPRHQSDSGRYSGSALQAAH